MIYRHLVLTAVVLLFALSGSASAQDKPEDLYKAKCAKCHGADGTPTAGGTKLGAKSFSDPEVAKQPDEKWIEITTKGEKKMPAYGKSLSEQQIKDLVTYIRSMAKK